MAKHHPSYKLLFSHRDLVADLIRGFVHEDWVEQLDFTTLQRVSEIGVSHDLREREDDMIWRLRWGERWVYVYLLLEFQSSVDRLMAVRLLTYVGLLYQDLAAPRASSPLEARCPRCCRSSSSMVRNPGGPRPVSTTSSSRADPSSCADGSRRFAICCWTSSGLPIPSWRVSAMSPQPCSGSRTVAGPRISRGSWRV